MTNNTTLGRIFYNPLLLEKYFLEVCKLMSYGNSNVEDQHKSLTESPKLIRGSHCWSPNGWFCLHKPHIRPWFPLQLLYGHKKIKNKKKYFGEKKKEGFSPYCQCWLPPCLKALLIPTFSPCVFLWVREANLANCIFVEEKSKPSHRLHLILTLDRILDQPDEEHFTGFYEIKKFSGRLNKIFIKAKKQLFKNAKIRYGF